MGLEALPIQTAGWEGVLLILFSTYLPFTLEAEF